MRVDSAQICKGLISIAILLGVAVTTAQPLVNASLEPKQIKVGEWAQMTVKIDHAKEIAVFWPSFDIEIPIDSSKSIEIIETSKIDTTINQEGGYSQTRTYTLTAWDSGAYRIPPVVFTYNKLENEELQSAASNPLMLTVVTLSVDTAKGLKPIKEPMDMPFQLSEIKEWLIGGSIILLLLVAVLVFLLNRKPKPVETVTAKVPDIPAHEIALQRLHELDRKKYWQDGEPKRHHAGITDTLREYLENRFGFDAQESTTEEISVYITRLELSESQREDIRWIFRLSDMVKFAKTEAFPDEHVTSLKKAIDFVNQTKKMEEVDEG